MSDNPETIEALISLNSSLIPLLEFAEGFKATMISRGWPEDDAQGCATLMMLKLIGSIFDGGLLEDDDDDGE